MELVHLANSTDDLYAGFDDLKVAPQMNAFQGLRTGTAVKFASMNGPQQPIRLETGFTQNTPFLVSSKGRMIVSAFPVDGSSPGGPPRPMTSIRGVGFSSRGNRGQGMFDPLSLSSKMAGRDSLLEDKEENAEEKLHQLERKVNELVEESCLALSQKDTKLALEKAKEAAQKERILVRQREQAGLADQPNLDLTFIVLFNLASQYAANKMFSESLNTYQIIMRNRMFQNAGRLKVNMGNIYVSLGQYSKAIKLYRMALDQVPNTHKRLRIKIMQNIGVLFVRMGKYTDAITSFEYIMAENPDFKTGLNLILCFYALGDREKMKKAFQKLVDTRIDIDDEEKHLSALNNSQLEMLREVIKGDALQQVERQKKQEAEWCILMAAKLISPVIDSSLSLGFSWCVDLIRGSIYVDLAHELEINKAITFLKQKEFAMAVESLQEYEKKKPDSRVASTAATNLSFLYIQQNELTQADKYCDAALIADHYNPGALVNKGCCFYLRGDIHKAQEYFKEALANEATCVEALFNLGLTHKRLNQYNEAYDCFTKLQAIVPNQPNVYYNIASICELLNEREQALEWYHQLLSLIPTDPGILQKMAELFEAQGDKQQAYQYYYDSYRYFPSKMDVTAWLGAYFVDSEVYEKAVSYFERATLMQPNEVKWYLMIASCHRRSGNYQLALNTYKTIHRKFPDNVECLKFLVRLSSDMGLKDANEYANLLAKAEKAQETMGQRSGSSVSIGRRSSSRYSRNGSAGSDISTGPAKSSKDSVKSPTPANDFSYFDPLGSQAERPRTSAARRKNSIIDEGFAFEEIGDDLLPE